MIDLQSLLSGAIGGLAQQKVQGQIEGTLPKDPLEHSTEDYIREIHHVLVALASFLKDQALTHSDVYRFVTLYKQGQGTYYRPEHAEDRAHFQIFSPVSVTLNVLDSGLLPFNITIPAATWTNIDLPEGSKYQLDAGFTSNSLVVYIRDTSADVI